MFRFRKSKDKSQKTKQKAQGEQGLVFRLKSKLKNTRQQLFGGLSELFQKKTVDESALQMIEERLLVADLGIELTSRITEQLTQDVKQKKIEDGQGLVQHLRNELVQTVAPYSQPLKVGDHRPFIMCVVGVNGSGKTTTIGKLAHQLQQQGYRVLMAAGDTFRAAAIEQLQSWGQKYDIPVIAQGTGSDSAAVIYDAVQAAQARHYDVVLADTAGRLHTQQALMAELQKVMKVIRKLDANAPHETMLVLDSGVGQNALAQAKQFQQAVDVNSLTLTKLDGTAKGGVLFPLVDQLHLPVRFIGVGERVDDLKPFDAEEFVDALIGDTEEYSDYDHPQ